MDDSGDIDSALIEHVLSVPGPPKSARRDLLLKVNMLGKEHALLVRDVAALPERIERHQRKRALMDVTARIAFMRRQLDDIEESLP